MAKGQGGTRTISVTVAQSNEIRNQIVGLSKKLPTLQAQVTKAENNLKSANGAYYARNKEMYEENTTYRNEIDGNIAKAEAKLKDATDKYNNVKEQYDTLANRYKRMTIKR